MSREEIRRLNTFHWNLTEEIVENLVSSSRWFIFFLIIYMGSKLVTLALGADFFYIFNNITSV